MATTRIPTDLQVEGKIVCEEIVIPPDTEIDAEYVEHQHNKTYGQSGTAVAATIGLHECRGTVGTVLQIRGGSIVACTGNATITIDVKKNGTTILSATFVLDSANTAYVSEAGTISVPGLVAGDVLTAVIAVNAGTGALGTGLWVTAVIDEDYAS